MLKHSRALWSEVSEVHSAEGHPSLTSPLILVTYSAKHAQLCVKETHELSVSMWFYYSVLFDSLQRRTVISNMCFFNAPMCEKNWLWLAPANDVFRCVSGKWSINSLNLIFVYSGQAMMELLALISINSVVIVPKFAAVGKTKFMEVDKTWQRWRSAL